MTLDDLTNRLRGFAAARDWERFHTPKNLAMALSVEASELVEIFQWLTPEQSFGVMSSDQADHVREELADILIYLVRVADVLDVDLLAAAEAKVDRNEQRFPSVGRRDPEPPPRESPDYEDGLLNILRDESRAVSPLAIPLNSSDLAGPGLYSWWVDQDGAAELALGLGFDVQPGLIYAGSAGATRWPSGKRSRNTLSGRVLGMHLGGRHEFSTFRRSLGSILAKAWSLEAIDEVRLTTWMHEHLRVALVPVPHPESLSEVERRVLAHLDPPLNLQHMPSTEVRLELSNLRRQFTT